MTQSDDITARDARAAAEIEPDFDVAQVADVYARALVDAAEKTERTSALLDEFDAIATDVFGRFPKLEAILASALVSQEEKVGILDRLFGGRVSPMMLNFLKVVSRHGRLDCLRAIHHGARLLYDEIRGRVHVRLTTAMPIGGAQAKRLAESLRTMVAGEPVVTRITDPELIGGAVLRIGDTVYDGSIANQLQVIRQQMIERSAHEIQSRRDRFRNSAGN